MYNCKQTNLSQPSLIEDPARDADTDLDWFTSRSSYNGNVSGGVIVFSSISNLIYIHIIVYVY
jgi:hypothetical protein